MYIIPSIFDSSTIIAAQSTRVGGTSPSPWNSLNLGMSVNDEKENVIKNRQLFFEGLGIDTQQLVISKQVHGNKVYIAQEPTITEGFDALITNKKNVFLAISVADCTPILIHDTRQQVVAAIHAGWKGTVAEIVAQTLNKMKEKFNTIGENCYAYIGACIDFSNFEVGEEVAQHFSESLKRFDAQKQKWYVNLKQANKQQLLNFGVKEEHIELSPYCTVKDENLFFSHRRDKGQSGRMMAVIGMKN